MADGKDHRRMRVVDGIVLLGIGRGIAQRGQYGDHQDVLGTLRDRFQ